jgi:hypothetical protein
VLLEVTRPLGTFTHLFYEPKALLFLEDTHFFEHKLAFLSKLFDLLLLAVHSQIDKRPYFALEELRLQNFLDRVKLLVTKDQGVVF